MANGNAIAKPDIGITVAGEGFAGLGEGGAGAGAKVFVTGEGGAVVGGGVTREGNGLASVVLMNQSPTPLPSLSFTPENG